MTPSVLITGAYGGMGRATATALRDRGFRVFALDKTVGAAEENILPVKADITDEKSVREAFALIRKQTEELFAVIHFAGIYLLDSLVEMDSGDFERIFRINLGGAFLVNKIFLPLLYPSSQRIRYRRRQVYQRPQDPASHRSPSLRLAPNRAGS